MPRQRLTEDGGLALHGVGGLTTPDVGLATAVESG